MAAAAPSNPDVCRGPQGRTDAAQWDLSPILSFSTGTASDGKSQWWREMRATFAILLIWVCRRTRTSCCGERLQHGHSPGKAFLQHPFLVLWSQSNASSLETPTQRATGHAAQGAGMEQQLPSHLHPSVRAAAQEPGQVSGVCARWTRERSRDQPHGDTGISLLAWVY